MLVKDLRTSEDFICRAKNFLQLHHLHENLVKVFMIINNIFFFLLSHAIEP